MTIRDLNDYQTQICIAEIAALKRALESDCARIGHKPHVKAALESPVGRFVTRHIQNCLWTIERTARKRSLRRTAQKGARDAMNAFLSPVPVSGARIYIDVTATRDGKTVGGIGRVATKLAEAAVASKLAIPVYVTNGKIKRIGPDGHMEPVVLGTGDTYLLIDHFWYAMDTFRAVATEARRVGARMVVCVYDLIPILHPAFIVQPFGASFAECFTRIVTLSDVIVTVSRSSAAEIEAYIAHSMPLAAGTDIRVFPLGADATVTATGQVRREIADALRGPTTFLSVGTVLPHKGHLVAVAAFDELWARGTDATYVILGREDRTMESIGATIREHREFGRRLFWFENANDAELDHAYHAARSLIQPSIAEGFGVPIVEALRCGLPVVASDIAIFRELGGDRLSYFPCCDSTRLADVVERFLDAPRQPRSGDDLTWTESLERLVAALQPA